MTESAFPMWNKRPPDHRPSVFSSNYFAGLAFDMMAMSAMIVFLAQKTRYRMRPDPAPALGYQEAYPPPLPPDD